MNLHPILPLKLLFDITIQLMGMFNLLCFSTQYSHDRQKNILCNLATTVTSK